MPYCILSKTVNFIGPISGTIGVTGSASSLETGLLSLWKLDETTGNAVDQKGLNSLVNYGATQNVVLTFNGTAWVNYATTISSSAIAYPAITMDETNSTVYVAYRDNSTNKLTVQKSTGTSWTSLGTTVSSGWANFTNIGVDTTNHIPIVSYEDHDATADYVKKYQ